MSKQDDVQAVVDALLRVHASHPDGLPTTLRFLFYELEQGGNAQKPKPGGTRRSKGWPPGSQDITDAATQLREAGAIPWDWLEDTERSVRAFRHAPSILEYLIDTLEVARINPWQPAPPPLILTESNGMALVLSRVADEYRCPIAGTKGFSNGFLRTTIAPLAIMAGVDRDVLYLGDDDRSGHLIEANSKRVLEDMGWVGDWERIGLLPVHTAGMTPLVKTDGRTGKTHVAYEVEALGQVAVVALVRDALDARLPEPIADVRERERVEREEAAERLA